MTPYELHKKSIGWLHKDYDPSEVNCEDTWTLNMAVCAWLDDMDNEARPDLLNIDGDEVFVAYEETTDEPPKNEDGSYYWDYTKGDTWVREIGRVKVTIKTEVIDENS